MLSLSEESMKTQVFRGRTAFDARRAATDALGKDAVVLTTRDVPRRGITGLFGGSDVEIAAAVAETTTAAPPAAVAAAKGPFASSAYAEGESAPSRDPIAALRAELRSEIRALKIALVRPGSGPSNDVAAEIVAIRDAIEQIAPKSARGDKSTAVVRAHGIEGGAAVALARATRAKGDGDTSLEERFRNALSELVQLKAWPLSGEGRAVIAVVGPAGVGKTTTLAKLAARARMDNKTVTLVACDTFRVGGVAQIERYADLLGVPCETARDADELASILAAVRTQFVFVDTAGKEPAANATERLLATDRFAATDACRGFARHVLVCVPAAIRAIDATRVARSFSATNPTAVAITKLDETEAPSGVVHATFASKLPISILCAGPRVPEDVSPATMGAVLDALTRRKESTKAAV
jgi:flagellar biosynthesis protein FlhF